MLLVRLQSEFESKTSQNRDFIGICQSGLCNDEVLVMFMKNCSKDNSLYVYNEQDVSTVTINQILKVLPTPTILLKGNRAFYKFNQQISFIILQVSFSVLVYIQYFKTINFNSFCMCLLSKTYIASQFYNFISFIFCSCSYSVY